MLATEFKLGDSIVGEVKAPSSVTARLRKQGFYTAKVHDENGVLVQEASGHNLVVNQGLNYDLNTSFNGSTAEPNWFIGLKGTGTPAGGDTLASHATWTEITTQYTGDRKSWDPALASAQELTDAADVFTFTGSTTVYGAFLCSDATSTSNLEILFSAGDFASSLPMQNGYTLTVTYTLTAADA